jgi:hypothetical protein
MQLIILNITKKNARLILSTDILFYQKLKLLDIQIT